MNNGKENDVATQVQQTSVVEHLAIVFPEVPKEVRGTVAPLFREWAEIAGDYERRPTSLRAAWLYLGHHPAFWKLLDHAGSLQVASGHGWYQFIETGYEEEDYVWMDIRPSHWPGEPTEEELREVTPDMPSHGIEILEHNHDEALAVAAATVHKRYGNDRRFLNFPLAGKWLG